MAYTAMYRRYRPLVFSDVVGQDHIVRALSNSIATGRISHAYLFCGTRGTGKTTMAKIFARAINCLHPENGNPCNQCEICKGILDESIVDVMEIDAASNNGVDSIRDIRDDVAYTPTVAKYKVYIIDEVHMLSGPAFNALLKTLEEPPEHAVFLLATTDPQRLPDTILSRVQRFNLKRISDGDIADRLLYIASDMGLDLSRETALYIARLADGALRDGISILDRCYSSGQPITMDLVAETTGTLNRGFIYDSCMHLLARDPAAVLDSIAKVTAQGRRLSDYTDSLLDSLRELLIYSLSKDRSAYDTNESRTAFLEQAVELTTPGILVKLISGINEAAGNMRWSSSPEITLSAALVGLCAREGEPAAQIDNSGFGRSSDSDRRIAALERRVSELSAKLESAMASGAAAPAPKPEPAAAPASNEDKAVEEISKNKSQLDKYPVYKDRAELITRVKDTKSMFLAVYIKDRPMVAPSDKVVAILFDKEEIRKTVGTPENLKLLSDLASDIAGHPVRVLVVDKKGGARQLADVEREVQGAQELADSLGLPLTIE